MYIAEEEEYQMNERLKKVVAVVALLIAVILVYDAIAYNMNGYQGDTLIIQASND